MLKTGRKNLANGGLVIPALILQEELLMRVNVKLTLISIIILLLLTNFIQAYIIFDNAHLVSDMQIGIKHLKEDRNTALLIVNEYLSSSTDEQFGEITNRVVKRNPNLIFSYEDNGDLHISGMVFTKEGDKLQAEYLNE
jgi:hypothetical protein